MYGREDPAGEDRSFNLLDNSGSILISRLERAKEIFDIIQLHYLEGSNYVSFQFVIEICFIYAQIEPDSKNKEANDANKRHEEEIAELKAKFLRHKEILKSNCDQAESEVVRLDEIYHDTVDRVLKVIAKY